MKKISREVQEIHSNFINVVSDVFGKAETNFTANEIVAFFSKYDIEHGTKINVQMGEGILNKRKVITQSIKESKPYHQYNIIKSLCELQKFKNNTAVQAVKAKLVAEYHSLDPHFEVNSADVSRIEEVTHWLQAYPLAYNEYKAAMVKYNGRIFKRNLLDDLRLSLELFLQELLGNKERLEKQLNHVGEYLKKFSITVEVRNMFCQLLFYYGKYQNEYAKHNSKVNEVEIDFIVDLTNSFMKFLLKVKK